MLSALHDVIKTFCACRQARLERERKLKEIAEAAHQGKLQPAVSAEAAAAAEAADRKKRCRAPARVGHPLFPSLLGLGPHAALTLTLPCPPRRMLRVCEGSHHPGFSCLSPPRLCGVAA